MPVRPDLIECWVFRAPDASRVEYLLIERATGIFPGLWQPVTGYLEQAERASLAALREVQEETGFSATAVEAFYDLDQIGSFYDEDHDAIVHSVMFAVRVRTGIEPRLSLEHRGLDWVDEHEALRRSVWPPYRDSIELIGRLAADPELARWFELDTAGRRVARPPG